MTTIKNAKSSTLKQLVNAAKPKATRRTIEMSQETFAAHCDEYNGICGNCFSIRYGQTEPDAENYFCEECESKSVQGMENAMISGLVEVV